ncbi:MAG: DUF1287 domain-containing protein [Gammaproteobacteria bacterium]|nr:DUF1287 domain-containing protein [Gammaproteobacteria bacterium]MBU1655410.1 DUF1287 domain-containing protein [Gammaproteobacteria bacterium]MBU1962155.1 DUF1287 domain-containing protein [Gammaproteobacteria bacterium]
MKGLVTNRGLLLLAALIPCGVYAELKGFEQRLAGAALEQIRHPVRYDGAYVIIPYPGGDVPANTGVCTDVLIRAYRKLGIDLQKEVHEEMRDHFDAFPKYWGLTKPDTNIDHRRVPNLQVFFKRRGQVLPITDNPTDYKTGDLVTWMLPGNLPHSGIVVDPLSGDGQRPLIVHNIGQGPKLEDILFQFPITGHYRYPGPPSAKKMKP